MTAAKALPTLPRDTARCALASRLFCDRRETCLRALALYPPNVLLHYVVYDPKACTSYVPVE